MYAVVSGVGSGLLLAAPFEPNRMGENRGAGRDQGLQKPELAMPVTGTATGSQAVSPFGVTLLLVDSSYLRKCTMLRRVVFRIGFRPLGLILLRQQVAEDATEHSTACSTVYLLPTVLSLQIA